MPVERDDQPGPEPDPAGRRRVVYCIVPQDLAPHLHDLLRRHFTDEPHVEVVVEQRRAERRRSGERRADDETPPPDEERRRVRSATGRRMGERRAATVAVEPPELPRRARRYAARLSFVCRREPAGQRAEDLDTARLVARIQSGDREAFATLYTRYFSRVYGYLRVVLKDAHEAEDATQQVFMRLMETLPRYERRRQPFRAWLFTAVRNQALDFVAKRSRIELMGSEELDDAHEQLASRLRQEGGAEWRESPQLSSALSWVSNQDLLVLIERLPPAQRQVLALRFMLGLTPSEIAAVMELTPNHVSALQYRALGFLRERLTALGREPKRGRTRMTRMHRKAPVLRLRRFALTK